MVTAAAISQLLFPYLLGSIPVALWIGRLIFGEDVRTFGSGNPGATNVYRKWGLALGILVFLLDAVKGAVAVQFLQPDMPAVWSLPLTAGLVILGHRFPVFARFRGGKGVSTAAGVLAVAEPIWFLFSLLVFGWTLAFGRRVSLASLVSITSVLVLAIILFARGICPADSFLMSCTLWILLVLGHYQNIRRLIRGEEPAIVRS